MKVKISKLSMAIATAALSFSGWLAADTTFIQVGTGYRQDSLTAHLNQGCAANVRAKNNLHYRDVEIVFLGVKAKSTFGCCDSYVRADFDYGWVLDGKVKEHLGLKNRRGGFNLRRGGHVEVGDFLDLYGRNDLSRSSFVWDLDLGFVYPIQCGEENELVIGPGIGFSVNRQHLHGKNRVDFGDASISSSTASRFDLSDLSNGSSYYNDDSCDSRHHHRNHNRTSWWGPWLGFDFAYNTCDCWNLYGEFEIHFGRVRHNRNSHISDENVYRNHKTRSFWGPSIKVGTKYVICEDWYLDGSFYYSKFYSYNSRNNDVKWATGNLRLDLGYIF